jgi:hypothetical protein
MAAGLREPVAGYAESIQQLTLDSLNQRAFFLSLVF